MSEYKYDKKTILEKTNNGLDVFKHIYPDCEKNGRLVPFKTHEEATPSTMIKEFKNGYMMTNFGDDGKAISCFDAVMQKEGLKYFGEACKWIASELNIPGLETTFNKGEIEFKAPLKDDKKGDCHFEYNQMISEVHLKVLGPLVTEEVCKKYHIKSCKKFIRVVEPKTPKEHKLLRVITTATDKYPIFVIDMGKWQKIYQPLNPDKQYRFSYAGNKPQDFLFGVENLIREYNSYNPDYDDDDDDDDRLPRVFIGAGDRDSLNIASLNEPVVWQNSETAILSHDDYYNKLLKYAKEVIYIGDLDDTGVKQTVKMALSHIDIKIAWLPDWIKDRTYRGKPRKDFTDWIKLVHDPQKPDKLKTSFNKILNNAEPARFWDIKRNKQGDFKGYTLSNERLYKFLTYNGYYIYKELPDQPEFDYVRIENGIVKKVFYRDLNNFPANYLKSKYKPTSLVDFIHRSAQLKESSLAKIPEKPIDFKDSDFDYQLLFFQNKIWEITKDEIKEYGYGKMDDVYVWDHKIIQHRVRINRDKAFEITPIGTREDNSTIYDIKILRKDNHFLNYLINTSRVHWRVCGDEPFKKRIKAIRETDPIKRKEKLQNILAEKEAYQTQNRFELEEEGLSPEQIQEQKDHLINKIFSFGYLLHRKKVRNKPWVVYAMDNRISDISDSNGGSGKSLMYDQAVRNVLLSNKYINGRDREAVKDKHMFSGVTKSTDYVLFDDLDSYFPFTRFFTETTGGFNVNAKYKDAYTIPFEDSPKIAMTSNFGMFKPDSSTKRRVLYNVFSDYYHYKSDLDETEHKITDDICKMLFSQFDESEWNDFYNLSAECIQFFLCTDEKIIPPLANVEKRNSLQTMGDAFKEWADSYFEHRLDQQIVKTQAQTDFEVKSKVKPWSSQKFKKSLKEWCKFYGYELNPEEVLNTNGFNKHTRQGASTEFIYIKTNEENEVEIKHEESLPDDLDPTDELEF
ncbi:primase-helicase family protein [Aquimarina spongiae]|uniref:Uncharacterized protein n=1 Tax=Aquimarina spongiae TaxID=570521 RepID=A0A1M6JE42_9FLAO|nr:primase-helicase family protein [Aquimarina spongiae]SHJ44999.1 hypothetical protein SAMN04488508_10918 [Aquimarina spongiae]